MKITEQYDELYIQFLYHFNVDRDYFECHEVMEELWLSEGRNRLLQGLLQVAVGLYHCRNDNISGSIKLFTGALEKLETYMAKFTDKQVAEKQAKVKQANDKHKTDAQATGERMNNLVEVMGINMQKLIANSHEYINRLGKYEVEPFEFYDLDIEIIDRNLLDQVEQLKLNPPQKDET